MFDAQKLDEYLWRRCVDALPWYWVRGSGGKSKAKYINRNGFSGLYKNKTEDTFQNNTAEHINCNVNGKLKMFISYTFVLSVNLLGQQGLAKILFELS